MNKESLDQNSPSCINFHIHTVYPVICHGAQWYWEHDVATWLLIAFSHLRMKFRFSARLRNATSYIIFLLMELLFSIEEDHMYLLEMRFHGILCVINPLQNSLVWAYYPLTILLIQNLNSSHPKPKFIIKEISTRLLLIIYVLDQKM